MKKKKIVLSVVAVIITFAFLNLFWYMTTHKLYSQFTKGMEKIETYTYRLHEDEFSYIVSYPSYLHFNTGCLSITNGDDISSLIIWPNYTKAYEFGVRVPYKGEFYEINMKSDGTPRNPYDQEIVDENKEVITELYKRAEDRWGEIIFTKN